MILIAYLRKYAAYLGCWFTWEKVLNRILALGFDLDM